MTEHENRTEAHAGEEIEDTEGTTELNDRAIIFLSGEIDRNHLQVCSALLNYHFMEDFHEPIQLIINSDGGDCSVGWSIVEVMNFIRLPVHTIGVGVVASMAADIFVNGDRRVIGEHSTLMIHPHSAIRFGSHSQLVAHARADSIEHSRRLAHYANNSKYKTTKSVEENLFTTKGDDFWLTPEEVLKHGLCDEIARTNKSKRRKAFGYTPKKDGEDFKLTKTSSNRGKRPTSAKSSRKRKGS